jgi:hypothetical protein
MSTPKKNSSHKKECDMHASIDFQTGITDITRILGIGQYTAAATECVKLCEQALRQVVSQYADRVAETVRRDLEEAAQKRVRGKGGIEQLTMGQMVYALRESKFLEECARLSGKNLRSLPVIDLEKLTQLRNKIIHEHEQATRTEAEFLLHSLKLILETFDLLTFDTPQ